jgi:hypothetical protein
MYAVGAVEIAFLGRARGPHLYQPSEDGAPDSRLASVTWRWELYSQQWASLSSGSSQKIEHKIG